MDLKGPSRSIASPNEDQISRRTEFTLLSIHLIDTVYWIKQNPGSISLYRASLDWKDNCEHSLRDSGDNDLWFFEPVFF